MSTPGDGPPGPTSMDAGSGPPPAGALGPTDVLLAEYIWTREEESQSQTSLIALTSVTVAVSVAILTALRDFESPLNRGADTDLSPFVWILIPTVPLAFSGWILYQAYQSLIRRAYLRVLEATLYGEVGAQVAASISLSHKGMEEFVAQSPHLVEVANNTATIRLRVPAGQTLSRQLNRKKSEGGSTSARVVMFFGLVLYSVLPVITVIISAVGAISAIDALDGEDRTLPYLLCGAALLAYVLFLCFLVRMIWIIASGSQSHWYRMARSLAVRRS